MKFKREPNSDWLDEEISRLHQGWSRYWPLIESLNENQLNRRLPEGRTVRQVLAHIAFWEEAAVGFVRMIIRGEEIPLQEWYGGSSLVYNKDEPWPAADVHNAREAQWATGKPGLVILARMQAARTQLLNLLNTVTPEEAAGAVGDYFKVESRAEHFEEHLPEIEALFKK
jgi:hypothetical protein